MGAVALAVAVLVLVRAASAAVRQHEPLSRGDRTAAAALWACVALPTAVQLTWRSRLLQELGGDPAAVVDGGQWWRLVTAVVVQDGGWAGAGVNLLLLAVAAVLAVRGGGAARAAVTFWVAGAALDALAVSAAVTVAGSSGATLALLAGTAVPALWHGRGRDRAWLAGAAAVGGLLWALGNAHGTAVVLGLVLGAALQLVWPRLPVERDGADRSGRASSAAAR